MKLAQAALEAHQVKGSPGLNAQNYGGFDNGVQSVVFEYDADRKVLNVLALCYRFHKPPRPGVLEAFYDEERQAPTPAAAPSSTAPTAAACS